MVLKRLFTTALGALGLGAFAAGTAFAQDAQNPGDGNIPAPDLFDDQIACTMNLPVMDMRSTTTVKSMTGAMTSPLDDAIGMGDVLLDTSNANIGTVLTDIGYVVPPGGNNCGQGMDATAPDGGFFVGAQDSSIPEHVAEGYTELLGKFMEVYGDPGMTDSTGLAGALAMARTALAMADADDANYDDLVEARDDALEDYNEAKAEFDAIAGGPIYQAGVAEWMAKSAVENAVVDYNDAVGMANMAKTTLDAMNYVSVTVNADDTITTASKYVPLTGTELTDLVTIADGMATVNGLGTATTTTALENYANADGSQFATVDAMTGQVTYTGTSNFDADGNLVVPTTLDSADRDGDGDTTEYLPTLAAETNVGTIRTRADQYKAAAAAFKKLRDDNTNPFLDTLYEIVYERAQAESDYYADILTDVLSDSTDQRTQTERAAEGDDAVDPYSIASRNTGYVRASNARQTAEDDLRMKAKAREDATEAVVAAFENPRNFYDQLVARRMALRTAATGDDVEDAQKDLTDAQKIQTEVNGLFDDPDSPTADLVNELLKTDGDDGDALVKAIDGTYDTAKGALDKATEVEKSVENLIGDDGQVGQNEMDIATNKADIASNDTDIENLDTRVTMNEDEIWGDADPKAEGSMSRIDHNERRSMTNAMEIGMDENGMSRIDHNERRSMDNAMEIGMDADGMSRIDHNERRSMANDQWIMDNSSRLDTAYNRSMTNEELIGGLTTRVGANETAINRNESAIMGLEDQMEIVRAGVAASMALAGMPAINGRGISIGVGSYDGESAFAVGFQIQGEMASFKVGVTSAGGETGASAGVGFQF